MPTLEPFGRLQVVLGPEGLIGLLQRGLREIQRRVRDELNDRLITLQRHTARPYPYHFEIRSRKD